MTDFSWDSVAFAFSEVADTRRSVVFPFVARRILDSEAHTVIDYGGGDGEFSAMVAHDTSARVVLYDPSPSMLRLATTRLSVSGNATVTGDSTTIASSSADVVAQIAVWMCLQTRAACMLALKDANRLLRPGGLLIAAVTHPCFRTVPHATFKTDFAAVNYLDEGTTFNATLFDGHHLVTLRDTHWSLGEMSRQLRDAGFSIEELAELPDRASSPTDRGNGTPWLVIFARKARP